MLDGYFVLNYVSPSQIIVKNPDFLKQNDITEDFFYEFIIDFVNKSPNEKLCANILAITGSSYAIGDYSEKANNLIQLLKTRYPKSMQVKEGYADKVLARLKTSIGTQAPEFEVKIEKCC